MYPSKCWNHIECIHLSELGKGKRSPVHLENDLVVSGKDRLGEGSVRGLGMDM